MKQAVAALNRMVDGLSSYLEARVDAGKPVRFPASAKLTPGAPATHMCQGGQPKPAVVNPESWSVPTWKTLGFKMEVPSSFNYQFVSRTRRDGTSIFTARAIGDLDCDGVYSTFERVGKWPVQGTPKGQIVLTTALGALLVQKGVFAKYPKK